MLGKTIKVSIIIPVYNVEKYLQKCLESLVNQTLKEIEIICINDGSTDKSEEILKIFAQKDDRIIVVNKENEGQSVARNVGIKLAKGEFLGFVDSDDWVDLDFFEKLYLSAKENNCQIACAGFKRCGKFGKSIRKKYKETKVYSNISDKIKADKLPDHNYIWNKIYLRECWDFPFPEGRFFEDMAILIQVLHKYGDMVTVPNVYYNYRKNTGSTVSLSTAKHREDFRFAIKQMYDYAKANKISLSQRKDVIKREILRIFNIPVLKIYYKENDVYYKLFGFIPFMTKNIF